MFVNNPQDPNLNPDEYFEPDMEEDDQSDESEEDMSEEGDIHGKRERIDKNTFKIENEGRRVRQKHMVIMSRHDLNVRDRVTFYGLAMKYEPVIGLPQQQQPLTELTLECTEARWFNERVVNEGLDRRGFWKLYPTPPTYRVTIMTGASVERVGNGIQFKTLVPEQEAGNAGLVEEGHWYRISLTPNDGGGPYAMVEEMQPSLAMGPPIFRSILRVDLIDDGNVLRTLKDVFHIGSGDVEPHVVGPPNASVAYVGLNNIGQGNCISLYGTDGRPFLYFDVGRSKSYASRPDTIKPCLSGSPSVILSHWDQDHYELGISHPELRYVPWLCPEAEVGGYSASFFNSVTHKRVWPANQKRFEEYPWGFVLFASDAEAGNKNDAGICLLVRIADDPNAPNPRPAVDVDGSRPQMFPDERYILMTGDSMFQHLPSCTAGDLDGLIVGIVAAHHGSYTGMDGFEACIPLAAEPLYDFPATVAYSLGIDLITGQPSGGYGHSHVSARNAYRLRGYHNVVMTNNSVLNAPFTRAQNVVLGWRRMGGPLLPPDVAIAAARLNYDAVEQTARESRLDLEAVRTVRDAAKVAFNAGNDPLVEGNNAIVLAAYTGKNPRGGTTAALNLVLNPLVAYPNDRAAFNAIEAFDTQVQNTAVTDATNAEPLAIALAVAVGANDP